MHVAVRKSMYVVATSNEESKLPWSVNFDPCKESAPELGRCCRNLKIKLDPARGEHWRPVAVTVPTSNGTKRMAFDQPFTCTSPQHLCLSMQQRCCAGKRHCCNCKKMLPQAGQPASAAVCAATASAWAHGSARTGSHSATGVSRGSTPVKESAGRITKGSAAPPRPRKRLFANLVAAASTVAEQGTEGGQRNDTCETGERAPEGPKSDSAGAGNACMSRGLAHATEGHLHDEVEDVASMLLLFCSPRCGATSHAAPSDIELECQCHTSRTLNSGFQTA